MWLFFCYHVRSKVFAELAPVCGCCWFVVYFWVKRLVSIIVDNLYDVIVVYLYICMYNIFSGEFQVGPCVNKRGGTDWCVFRVHFPPTPLHKMVLPTGSTWIDQPQDAGRPTIATMRWCTNYFHNVDMDSVSRQICCVDCIMISYFYRDLIMSESDDENVAGLSLEGLAQELESLRGLQRIVVVPKERVVGKFTGDSWQLSVRDFGEQVRAAWVVQASQKEEVPVVAPVYSQPSRRSSSATQQKAEIQQKVLFPFSKRCMKTDGLSATFSRPSTAFVSDQGKVCVSTQIA